MLIPVNTKSGWGEGHFRALFLGMMSILTMIPAYFISTWLLLGTGWLWSLLLFYGLFIEPNLPSATEDELTPEQQSGLRLKASLERDDLVWKKEATRQGKVIERLEKQLGLLEGQVKKLEKKE